MKGRLLIPVASLAILAAGCGGGGGAAQLAAGDIAVVGSSHIQKPQFDTLMSEAAGHFKSQGQTFPKAGTSAYSSIKNQAVAFLVQQAETESEAGKLGITVTPAEVDKTLTAQKKQYFGGDEKKYLAALKAQGLTDAEVRDNIQRQLFDKKLFDKLTKDVTVTKTAIAAYYIQHLTQYQQPASRAARYILVGKNQASLAATLLGQLKGAADSVWCSLAKKYSKDPSSSGNCGKATFSQGQTVTEFDKELFSMKTNDVATVNSKQYGWFVLQATAAVKPAHKSPVNVVGKQIEQTLLQTKKNAVMTAWLDNLQKSYCKGGKIKYQAGYQPSPDPCVATATTT